MNDDSNFTKIRNLSKSIYETIVNEMLTYTNLTAKIRKIEKKKKKN